MSTPNTQPPQSGNPFLQSYQAWSVRTPFVTRVSTITLTIVYILTWIIELESWLANIPFFVLFYFEIYRLIFSPLVGNSLFTLILVYLVYPSLGVKMENSMGSSAFLYLIFFFVFSVNFMFTMICILFYLLGSASALAWVCMDFWTLLFALITLDCMQTPDMPRRLMFIPVDIPSKYIPLLLYVIICLFSGFILSYAISMAMGYLWMKGSLDKFRPSSQYLSQLEAEGGLLHGLSRASGWVLAGTLGHDAWIPLNVADPSEHGMGSDASASSSGARSIFGTNAGSGTGADHNPMHESQSAFPGSGRKLTEAAAAQQASSQSYFGLPVATATFAETIARPPTVVAAVSNAPSREEVAARRLAALEAQQRSAGNIASGSAAPSAPPMIQPNTDKV